MVKGSADPLPHLYSPLADTIVPPRPEARFEKLARALPGVFVGESFGGIDPPRISIRGSGIQSAPPSRGLHLNLDGHPFNFADGSFNLALLESAWIDRIDLVRGPAAGLPSLGGELSLRTRVGAGTGPSRASATIGSHSLRSVSLEQTQLAGQRHPAAAFAHYDYDGWRGHSAQDRTATQIGYRTPLGEGTTFHLQARAVRARFDVPGPLTRSDALGNPEFNIPPVLRDRPRRATEAVQLGGSLQQTVPDGEHRLALSALCFDDDFRLLRPNGTRLTRGRELALDYRGLTAWHGTVPQTSALRLLVQAGWNEREHHRNDNGRRGAPIGQARLEPLSLTAAIDHSVEPGEEHRLELGASLLHARRRIIDRDAPTDPAESLDTDLASTRTALRAAWVWTPDAHHSVTLGWARSFEPPTFDDLLTTTPPPNAPGLAVRPLDWQRADSWELRLDRAAGSDLSWQLALHYAEWDNELLRLANPDGSTRGTVNADKTLHYGTELAAAWQFFEHGAHTWTLEGSYLWQHLRVDDDPVFHDNQLGGLPPHSARLALHGRLPRGWFVRPQLRWQGGTLYADHANRLGDGGHLLADLDIGRDFGQGWSLIVSIENLFDHRHIGSTAGVLDRAAKPARTPIFLPGSPRRAEIRIRKQW